MSSSAVSSVDLLIAFENRRHEESILRHEAAIEYLLRLRDTIAMDETVCSVASWLSYSSLAIDWRTSKDGAKKRVARLGRASPVRKRIINGRVHVSGEDLAAAMGAGVPVVPPPRPGCPGDDRCGDA